MFDAYDAALRQSRADVVYVSLPNSDHAVWAQAALESGRHVIVDKPLCVSLAETRQLVACARRRKRLLAEAIVYADHPQIVAAREMFTRAGVKPRRITALFSFPPLDPADFRYQPELGGGAINDLGPYAVSVGELFFQQPLARVWCRVNTHAATGVETAFSMMAAYPGGRTMIGHFGFDTEYQNRVSLLGSGVSVELDRVFTIPADYPNTICVRRQNVCATESVPPSDCFADFFKRVFDDCRRERYDVGCDQVLRQAQALTMLQQSATKEGLP